MKHFSMAAASLLAACASASAQVAPLPMALCAGWNGERVCEVLQEDAQIRVLRCTFPPGVGHEPHYHPPHFGYVLEGNSTMRITTTEGVVDRPVRAGTSFSNDAEIQHAALNVGAETTRYLIIEKKYADARPLGAVAAGLCAAN
jgi:quercetin dioxygenase-like cupin family protein